MPRILIEGPVHECGLAILRARPDVELDYREGLNAAALAEGLERADALIIRLTPLAAEAIKRAPNLKTVARMGVGYDHIDVAALTRRGIPLTIVVGALSASVAEHTLLLMLGVNRRIAVMDRNTRTGRYAERFKVFGHELLGKTVLIVGLGGIGGEAAKRCAAFGMWVIASGREASRKAAEAAGYEFVTDFHAALPRADFVSLHLPARPDGTPLLGKAEFAAMKPGAVVINTARGSLIDEAALYQALTDGTLLGAGLDVTQDEPPAPDCPLLGLDNVLVTPHNSALCVETGERVAELCASNVLAALDGRLDPVYVVNGSVL
ncbi:MAG: NAD(P)-dependent oxidoreductase [Rhodospirillaceae bacterium]